MLINILKLSLQCNNLPLFLKIIENICIRGETSLCRRKRNEQKYNYKQLLRGVVSTSFDQNFILSHFIFFLFWLTTRAILRLLFYLYLYRDCCFSSQRKDHRILLRPLLSHFLTTRKEARILWEWRSKIARPSCVPTMISRSKKTGALVYYPSG